MDQTTAQALFESGACLVILDTPTGIEFGIDLDTWETGPLFKGLKMIPPGIHYIHYSALNGEKQPGMRSGFFHNFSPREAKTEDLVVVNEEDTERIRQNIRDLDKGLGAYQTGENNQTYTQWQQLTCKITPKLLHEVLPPHGCFSSATGSAYEDEEMAAVLKKLKQQAPAMAEQGVSAADLQSIIDAEPTADCASTDRFNFTPINIRHSFPPHATPDELRRFSKDKSWLLRSILQSRTCEDILGEFQLAFLVILVGQNFCGIEHWKRILHLVLGSAEVLGDARVVETVVVPVLRCFMSQLRVCPHEFVASVLEQDNFVAEILQEFVLNVYESGGGLDPEIARLRAVLKMFDWVLPEGQQLQTKADEEEGEYAPQVVDL
ncbi:hypothetical protein IWW43_003297 [Coemansia sp. RSA 1935]|nr:hypothetical protein IWW43_003297 [Coemansia sp. RSA 1935]